ncbi:MAG: ribonucleotide-diphosphate reductase subunit beta [Gemmatimonadaceae bacterium]|jgi:ribonucleoside-diphosphate reductase beta chain|nr:ribonucleotide-diphosphate reductase subunit beta [Gemmatimonadaceae bacterium]
MPLLATEAESSYFQLFVKAKRLHWDPATIDLTRDRDDWAMIRRDHAAEQFEEQILRLCSLFYQGEESVTKTLAPLLSAVPRAGLGLDKELHLAAQLYEEAKHFDFFQRYFTDVLEQDGAASQAWMQPAPQAVLVDDLDAVTDRLRREDDPEALRAGFVEAVTHYMGVVEAMLARTGYVGVSDALSARGWLPGLQEGFRLIRRDEGRHVAFGIRCIAEMTAARPDYRPLVQATFERQLPNVLGTIAAFDYPTPLVDIMKLQQFAIGAYTQFMAAAGLTDDADALAALRAELDEV